MTKDLPASRIEVVECLRGIAALGVAWFHFTHGSGLLHEGWLKASGAYGWLGVEVFFVISGFIIPYSMRQGGYAFPGSAPAFIAKRLIRLEPPYLAAVVLAIALWYVAAAMPGFRGPPPGLTLSQVLLHVGYLNPYFGEPWVNPVFWSLAIEFQFYFLCALMFPALAHRRPEVRFGCIAAFLGSPFVIPDALFVFHFAGPFTAGMAAFLMFVGLADRRTFALLLALATAVSWATLGGPFAIAVAAAATAMLVVRVRVSPALLWLGAISYSVYLVHVPIGGRVMNLAHRLPDAQWIHVLALVLAVATTLAAASIFRLAFERPAQRWSSRLRYGSRAAGSARADLGEATIVSR